MRFVDLEKEARRTIQTLLGGDRIAIAPVPPISLISEVRLPEPADLVEEPAPEPIPLPARDPAREMAREEEREGPPFRLRSDVVNRQIQTPSPGIFVLSYDRTQETRVGRADEDLRATLSAFEGEYAYFYFETIDEPDERYFRECELFHRLGGDRGQLDNTSHPKPPESVGSVDCPVCVAAKLR